MATNWRTTLAAALLAATGQAMAVDQTVFLDFTTKTGGALGVHGYTAGEIGTIAGGLSERYGPFGLTFTTTKPSSGEYSTIFFNSGAVGTSTGVDFRNTKKSDFASVDALEGLALVAEPATSENIVIASINLGSHELNHILGARHHDAFTLPGAGVSTPGNAAKFDPVYPGPMAAGFTGSEINALATVLGFSADKLLSPDAFIGPRAALKLLFPDHGISNSEDDGTTIIKDPGPPAMPGPQALSVASYELPNTLPLPPDDPLASASIFAKTLSVRGELSFTGESDYFSFIGTAGEVWTIELMSDSIEDSLTEFDANLALLDEFGGPVDYYGDTTINKDGFEGPDPLLLDVVLPTSGKYVIEVYGDSGDFGEYELLAYSVRVEAVPLPGAFWLLLPVLGGMAYLRRRG